MIKSGRIFAVFLIALIACSTSEPLLLRADEGDTSLSTSTRNPAAAVSAGAGTAAAAAALGSLGLQLAGIVGSSNGDRAGFVSNVLRFCNSLGYNVVVCHPPSLGIGQERQFTLKLRYRGKDRPYKVYVARRHIKMQVANLGDGGSINWGLQGTWWVRWGNTVRFHPSWNAGMGKPYETRPADKLPPF